jgi:hypothetical protein
LPVNNRKDVSKSRDSYSKKNGSHSSDVASGTPVATGNLLLPEISKHNYLNIPKLCRITAKAWQNQENYEV